MTYKQKLTDLLCTLDAIEKQIKELKFGCKIIYNWEIIVLDNLNYIDSYNYKKLIYNPLCWKICDLCEAEIIWNPIEYHHLMMYCKEKNFWFIISKSEVNIRNKKGFLSFEIEFDNTKPLSEQSEEVYEQILIALKGLSN